MHTACGWWMVGAKFVVEWGMGCDISMAPPPPDQWCGVEMGPHALGAGAEKQTAGSDTLGGGPQ